MSIGAVVVGVVVVVAFANNLPILLHVLFILPMAIAIGVRIAGSDIQKTLNIIVVCLVYAGFTGQYEFSATFGLLGVWLLAVQHRLGVSNGVTALMATIIVQVWFILELGVPDVGVYLAFILQLVVIMLVNYKLHPRGKKSV
jgi:hypothetical protein